MSTKMFYRYLQPEGYIPNNHPHCHPQSPFYDTIVRGTTPEHSFELPFDMEEDQGHLYGDISDLIVTYKQGLNIVLTKRLSQISHIDRTENHHSIIYYTLTQEETNLFKVTDPNNVVQVQIKIMLNGDNDNGEHNIVVTPILFMNVLPELNGERMGD